MSTDISLIAFKAISNFTKSLSEIFGTKQRSLKLYAHLINKTTISHNKPIQKHIEAFRIFCIDNRDAIIEKNIEKLSNIKIVYSNRVYINIQEIFNNSDEETNNIIWNHILTISALVDPGGKAKQILKENSKNDSKNEANFLSDIIGKIDEHTDINDDPMKTVSSIMQSGVFTDLIQGMGNGLEDGSLDIGKLMGTVQNMLGSLNVDIPDNNQTEGTPSVPDLSGMMNMLNNIQDNNNPINPINPNNPINTNNQPDLSGMMNMMGPMLGALTSNIGNSNNNPNNIEDQINKQLENAKKSGKL